MSYLRHGSAASHLGLEDVPSSSFEGIELVHLTGITMALSETARSVVVETARRARALGLVVIFDPNYRPPLWDSPEPAGRACGELFPYVDWLLCGREEGAAIFGVDDPGDLVDALASDGVDAVVRVGDRGAVLAGPRGPAPVVPRRVESMADEVGAGDGFAAGFSFGLLAGWPPARCARAGNLIAAWALRGRGTGRRFPCWTRCGRSWKRTTGRRAVETRRLGSAGPEITRLGFGAWAAGGPWQFGWGSQDDDASISAIRAAVEGGVNWVDTAAVYGLGHSEEIVAEALEPFDVGAEVLVFTKCGRNWYESDGESIEYDLRPDSIRFECEQSLKRLGIERIDLYQFHWPDPVTGTQVEDSWSVIGELIDEGKARWGGVSNFDVELLERCEAVRHVDSLQPPLSLLRRGASGDVIPWCEKHGTGVIVYSPMGPAHRPLRSRPSRKPRRGRLAARVGGVSGTTVLPNDGARRASRTHSERLGTNLPSLASRGRCRSPGSPEPSSGGVTGSRRRRGSAPPT